MNFINDPSVFRKELEDMGFSFSWVKGILNKDNPKKTSNWTMDWPSWGYIITLPNGHVWSLIETGSAPSDTSRFYIYDYDVRPFMRI